MKIAVLSDVHGNAQALDVVLADVDREAPDQTWVLGDLAALGTRPNECVTQLRERHEANEKTFRVIGGNTDRYLVTNARMSMPPAQDADALAKFVAQSAVINQTLDWNRAQLDWDNYAFLAKIVGREIGQRVDGYGYVLGYHAIPGNDETNITADTPNEAALDSVLDRPLRMGLYGHIHRQLDRDLGRVRLVNVGSVGLSFDQPGLAQYAVLTFDAGEVTVQFKTLTYDRDAAIADAAAVGHPSPEHYAHLLTKGL